MSAVRVNGELTEWFHTVIRVLQGRNLSPLLFNILLEVVMALAPNGNAPGVHISGSVISDLRFADDIALFSESECNLQYCTISTKLMKSVPDLG